MFKHFKKGEEFFCFAGQSNQAVTGMYNLNRASQMAFPGEKILYEAKEFSTRFLREKQASNELLDKWIIMKDLPGEVYIYITYCICSYGQYMMVSGSSDFETSCGTKND